jgi:hypothetical protein
MAAQKPRKVDYFRADSIPDNVVGTAYAGAAQSALENDFPQVSALVCVVSFFLRFLDTDYTSHPRHAS